MIVATAVGDSVDAYAEKADSLKFISNIKRMKYKGNDLIHSEI